MEEKKIPQMCRLCLTRKHFFYNFIDSKTNWALKIKQITGMDVNQDLRYPQKLCINCRKRLDTWSQFRERCLRSQIQYKKEFLNDQEISEDEKPIQIETVLIKQEPVLSLEMTVESQPVTKVVKNNKLEKYWDWSDDDFFQSSVKLDNDESEEEFYELVTVVQDNDDDKEEEIILKVEEKMETVETEIEKAEELTESEPDCYDFNEPKVVRKSRESREKVPYGICQICGKSLLVKSMEYHLNWHSDLRPFKCTVDGCEKTFNSPKELRKHQSKHSDPKCICHICGKKFYVQTYLTRHMLKHTKDWKCICIYCSKKCATKYNLKVHMRIHTGDRPFSCNKCQAAFAYNSLLKSHKEKCERRNEKSEEEDSDDDQHL